MSWGDTSTGYIDYTYDGQGNLIQDNKIPTDPWGEPYQYRYPGVKNKDRYDLWSKGPDKTDGTDDDIGNW